MENYVDNSNYIRVANGLGWVVRGHATTNDHKTMTLLGKGVLRDEEYILSVEDVRFTDHVWEQAHRYSPADYRVGIHSIKKALMQLADALREEEVCQWTLTDPDSHQMRCRSREFEDEYELFEVRETPDGKFVEAHAFIPLNDYSEEEIQSVLEAYDGLLDNIDKDDIQIRNALIAEALFESMSIGEVTHSIEADDFGIIAKGIDDHIAQKEKAEADECECNPEHSETDAVAKIVWRGKQDIKMQLDELFVASGTQLDEPMKEQVLCKVMEWMNWDKLIESSITLGNERIADLIRVALNEEDYLANPDDFVLNDAAVYGPDEDNQEVHLWFDVPVSYLQVQYDKPIQAEVEISFPKGTKLEDIPNVADVQISPVAEEDGDLTSYDWEPFYIESEMIKVIVGKWNPNINCE